MAVNVLAVSIDGADITTLAEFWAGVLDRPVSPGATDGSAEVVIRDGLRLLFHHVPEAKVVKNRVHLDLATPDYEAETERLITLGAVLLHTIDVEQSGSRWRTFADPEGNEFDLVAIAA